MVKCQYCGSENETWYVFCQNCGKRVAGDRSTGVSSAVTGSRPAMDSQLSFRSAQDTGSLLDDILPEQSTIALDESILPKEVAGSPTKPGAASLAGTGEIPSDLSSTGIPPRETTTECPSCHKSIPETHSFCGFCGWHVEENLPVPAPPILKAEAPSPSLKQGPTTFMLMRVREDGSFDCGLSLRHGETLIGREAGDLSFPTDSLLSKRHARVIAEGGALFLEDLGSTNGTFLRLKRKKQLQHGEYLLIGKQLLRFEMEAPSSVQSPALAGQTMVLGSLLGKYEAKLIKRLPNGKDSNEYPLTETVTHIGREKGEITFKNDPFVSGKHARIQLEAGSYTIEDLNSSNGTYMRLRQKEEIREEDFFIVGEQLFQVRLVSQ